MNLFYSLDEDHQSFVEGVVLNCQNLTTNFSLPYNESANVEDYLSFSCNFCDVPGVDKLWEIDVCDLPSRTTFNICVYVLYISILVVAVVGNLLVVYVVWGTSKLRTVTNYFIVNLAVGDLFMAIFCVPFSFLSTLILQYWPFGFHLCIIVNYLQAVSVFVSAYTLVAISMDRYLAIIYPLRPRMTRLQSKLIILVDIGAAYSAALMLLQYFLPITVLVFTYFRIALVVWGKRHLGETPARVDRLAKSSIYIYIIIYIHMVWFILYIYIYIYIIIY
ncbi:UNVERIFIED_CONTAM: hypothetical protein GTU68_060181 [Idotea baltica]|nr:hypothetical protein [Idotea baltica]